MQETKGHCKHGEFDLREGCPLCIVERVEADVGVSTEYREEAEAVADFLMPIGVALSKSPGADTEALSYYTEATKLQKYAEGRVITTIEDIKLATDDLSVISKLKKAMVSKRKSLLDPLKLQADAIRDTYNYLMAPVLEADKITRDKMLAYDAEVKRIRQEQEEINRLRMEAAQKEMGLNGELTESVNLVEVEAEAPKRISTDMATSGQRDNWKWQVTDFALLSDEYKVVDGSQLTAIAKKHHDKKEVVGVRFYNEPGITVRAR